MTDRIREFLRNRRRRRPRAWWSISTSCATTTTPSPGAARQPRVLCREGEPGAGNPALLAELGSCFDCASVAEIEMALAAGASADRISFGNTIKKERDIARAFAAGVRLFAVDCEAEVEKIARAAPGAKVFCRILCDGAGAEWPLSRKFGCDPRWRPTCSSTPTAGPRGLRHVVPRRFAAAQPAGLGPGARARRRRVPHDSASAASS
jgi:ornithine decarboxylase